MLDGSGSGVAPVAAAGRDPGRPPWRKLLREAPAAARLLLAQLRKPPFADPSAGSGKPVLVLPAFLANDIPTALLRRTLRANGFRAYGWDNGLNLGARRDLLDRLGRRLDEVVEDAGGPVALIGWSLGGLYARELAKRRPKDVALVITLGTPFSVDLRRNNAWKLYELINDHPVDDPPLPVEVDAKPPVRTIAVWSRRDGIVAPASAQGAEGEVDETIEVRCTHNEMVSDPEPLALIVSLLTTRFSHA
ncbi:MAG TPA: alpha/beta hydrolase [Allosphingosinicella sp.]|jgi:pimeloyl-ACP methyl ester carboxylesterase